jgi:hypothetical protein
MLANSTTCFAAAVCGLKSLVVLCLGNNLLRYLPDALFDLNLVSLDLVMWCGRFLYSSDVVRVLIDLKKCLID